MRTRLTKALFPDGQAAFVSPWVDFMMLGGISLFLIPLVLFPIWESEVPKQRASATVFYLLFVVNLPHFVHSYQLLYPNYLSKAFDKANALASRLRYILSGLLVPVGIVAFLLYGTLHPAAMTYAASAVLFLTGWHYVKQGYGVMMMLSARHKVYYSDFGKRLLLINAYIAWVFAWIQYNTAFEEEWYFGVPLQLFSVPDDLNIVIVTAFVGWTLFAIILFTLHSAIPVGVSMNALLAYGCSVYAWVVFANTNRVLVLFVPALHSLQYLLIVWKIKYEKERAGIQEGDGVRASGIAAAAARRAAWRRMAPFLTFAFVGGALAFLSVARLDASVGYRKDVFGPQYFMFCFTVFFNIHHYFIDFAIWRRDNPEMKYLFR